MSLAASVLILATAAPAAGLKVDHQPVACMIKDRFPVIAAAIEPTADVERARLYFKAAQDESFYFVDMTLTQGRFEARLPKPKEKAGSVVYYIEASGAEGTTRRTPEISAAIVNKREACPEGGSVAAEGSDGDVRITSTTASRSKPGAFSGIAAVGSIAAPAEKPAEAAVAPASTTPEPAAAPAPTPTPTAPPVEVDYQIGPEDILKINVFGHADLTQAVIVQSDGTFMFPLVGRVKASDMTPKELERKLTILLAQGFIRSPQVTVQVQEYRSRTVMVMGEVGRPGTYPLSGNLRIVEILSRAGIGGSVAEVQVVRPLTPTDRPILPTEVAGQEGADPAAAKQAEIIHVDLHAIASGDLDKNILLRPNDTVYVPPAAKFFVSGEAKSPGAFAYTPGITVREAIIIAGGFSENASTGRIRLVREVDGKKKELKAKLDDPIKPGDIIVIKAKLF